MKKAIITLAALVCTALFVPAGSAADGFYESAPAPPTPSIAKPVSGDEWLSFGDEYLFQLNLYTGTVARKHRADSGVIVLHLPLKASAQSTCISYDGKGNLTIEQQHAAPGAAPRLVRTFAQFSQMCWMQVSAETVPEQPTAGPGRLLKPA